MLALDRHVVTASFSWTLYLYRSSSSSNAVSLRINSSYVDYLWYSVVLLCNSVKDVTINVPYDSTGCTAQIFLRDKESLDLVNLIGKLRGEKDKEWIG